VWIYIAAPLGAFAVYGLLLAAMPNRLFGGGPGVEVFPDPSEEMASE
jgi:hypothetical protein